MSISYPSNLSDAEWECLRRHLPPLPRRARPPIHPLRAIFDAIFYILRDFLSVALFALQLPTLADGVLPFSTLTPQRHLVSPAHDLARSRTRTSGQECVAERSDHGCGIRVKTVEESAGICDFDAHKCVKGRKRHILVDTLGLLLSVYVTPANLHDSKGARCLLAGLAPLLPCLKKIWADSAYRGQELAQWCLVEAQLGSGSSRAHTRHARVEPSASEMGGGANIRVAFSQQAIKQGLRAKSTNE